MSRGGEGGRVGVGLRWIGGSVLRRWDWLMLRRMLLCLLQGLLLLRRGIVHAARGCRDCRESRGRRLAWTGSVMGNRGGLVESRRPAPSVDLTARSRGCGKVVGRSAGCVGRIRWLKMGSDQVGLRKSCRWTAHAKRGAKKQDQRRVMSKCEKSNALAVDPAPRERIKRNAEEGVGSDRYQQSGRGRTLSVIYV